MHVAAHPWPSLGMARRCAVCSAEVAAARALGREQARFIDCGAADCSLVLNQALLLPEAQVEGFLALRARSLAVQRERLREQGELVAALREQDAEQDRRLAAALAEPGAQPLPTVSIPRAILDQRELPTERAARYEDHLREIIAAACAALAHAALPEAADEPSGERETELRAQEARFEQDPALRARCDALCIACGGGCCSRGGDHAYLRVETMRAQLQREPGLDAETLRRRYLDHLPQRSVDGACINQTASGCSLPRELRSTTCNSFYCRPLRAFLEQDGPAPALVVQRDHGPWDQYDQGEPHPLIALARLAADGSLQRLPLPDPSTTVSAGRAQHEGHEGHEEHEDRLRQPDAEVDRPEASAADTPPSP